MLRSHFLDRSLLVALSALILVSMVGCQRKAPQTQSESPPPAPQAAEKRQDSPAPATPEVLQRSQGEPAISIDQITENGPITGRVTGLAAAAAGDFKVVVYVHTDQWYIHPYAAQGEGRSWATLRNDLRWAIQSVKRQYTADQVAALLVTKSDNPPATCADLSSFSSRAWVIVRGTGAL